MTPAASFTRFGKYEIVRKLGRSMADVYLAFDPANERQVVLKIIEQCRDSGIEMVVDAERRGAMIQEQLHARDPRILEIYEYGEREGCFFVAMQYVEGRTLAEVLRREGRLEARRAAVYAAEILSQLASLHSYQAEMDGQKRAVVHGDIKPSNIQAGAHGEVWLLDFGIAKAITATRNMTRHDFGSPAYCSPERLKNTQVDPQADLWGVGVCLYELLSGVPPYQARSTRKLEGLIQSRRPPRALPDTCPAALKAIVWKALAGGSARRYASASDFEKDLRAFLAGGRVVAEGEQEPSWEAGETMERAAPPAPRGPLRRFPGIKSVGRFVAMVNTVFWTLAAGLLLGAFGYVWATQLSDFWSEDAALKSGHSYNRAAVNEIEADWTRYGRLKHDHPWLMVHWPAAGLGESLRARLVGAADSVLDAHRNGAAPGLQGYDWQKAHVALGHALELDPSSEEVRGKLALCEGYTQLLATPPAYAPAQRSFEEAEAALPRSPDPHLGLAQVFVYGLQSLGPALAEWNAAERLGYRLGPRELEQQADGFLQLADHDLQRYRGEKAAASQARYLAQFRRDAERARNLYESIAGYSSSGRSLERLDEAEALAEKVRTGREQALRRARLKARYYRRWP